MRCKMRELLEKKYKIIFEKYDLPHPIDARNITITIKNLIIEFLKDAKIRQYIVMVAIQRCLCQILCMS